MRPLKKSLKGRAVLAIIFILVYWHPLQAATWFDKITDPQDGKQDYTAPQENELVGTKYTLAQIENATDAQLARRFAPVFFFNKYEEWLPIDPEVFIEEARLMDENGSVLVGRTELRDADDLRALTSGDEDEILSVPGGRFNTEPSKTKLRGGDKVNVNVNPSYRFLSDTPVYANVIHHGNKYIDLVYFVFYAFNGCMNFEFKTSEFSFFSSSGSTNNHEWCNFGLHEGDWEVVTVRLRKTDANDGYQMATVQMYAHGEGHPYHRIQGGGISFWHTGGYERVKVYSALNTHGLYPAESEYIDKAVINEEMGYLISGVFAPFGGGGFSFNQEFIRRVRTLDITNTDIRPSVSGDSIGAGKFSSDATARGFVNHGDKVRLDVHNHGNSLVMFDDWDLTNVYNGRWGQIDRDNSDLRPPTGNVKHFSDDKIEDIAELAIARGFIPDDMVTGNGPTSPWKKDKIYFGINGNVTGKTSTKAVAIAYNSNRSEIANEARDNRKSIYVAGLYGSDGELWMGQGKQPHWENYSVMRFINTEEGFLYRWRFLTAWKKFKGQDPFEFGGGVTADVDMHMGEKVMRGSMPVTATITPMGEDNKYMIGLLWQYRSKDKQMIRNRVLWDGGNSNLVDAIDVVVQAQSDEDFTYWETPRIYGGINCNLGKRAHVFYAKTTGQVYMATRALVSDVYASKNDYSWFNLNPGHCKKNGHWRTETHERNLGFYNRDAEDTGLRVANGLNNITDIAGVFSREINNDHRHLVFVAANEQVKVYKVLEKGRPSDENPLKESKGSYTFNNWGRVNRLDSFKSDLHWRVYTAYTKKGTGRVCLARTPIWGVDAEPVVIRCLTLNGSPVEADDVSITGKEDDGNLTLQIAYSDRNDSKRTKVLFLDAGTSPSSDLSGALTLQ